MLCSSLLLSIRVPEKGIVGDIKIIGMLLKRYSIVSVGVV
jgi:hypothetical protein